MRASGARTPPDRQTSTRYETAPSPEEGGASREIQRDLGKELAPRVLQPVRLHPARQVPHAAPIAQTDPRKSLAPLQTDEEAGADPIVEPIGLHLVERVPERHEVRGDRVAVAAAVMGLECRQAALRGLDRVHQLEALPVVGEAAVLARPLVMDLQPAPLAAIQRVEPGQPRAAIASESVPPMRRPEISYQTRSSRPESARWSVSNAVVSAGSP